MPGLTVIPTLAPESKRPKLYELMSDPRFPQDELGQNQYLDRYFQENLAEMNVTDPEEIKKYGALFKDDVGKIRSALKPQVTPEQEAQVQAARARPTGEQFDPATPLTMANATISGGLKAATAPLYLADYLAGFAPDNVAPYLSPGAAVGKGIDYLYPIPENQRGLDTQVMQGLGQFAGTVLPARAAAKVATRGVEEGMASLTAARKAATRFNVFEGLGFGAKDLSEYEAERKAAGKPITQLQHLGAAPFYGAGGMLGALTESKMATTEMGALARAGVGAYLGGTTNATQVGLEDTANRLVFGDEKSLAQTTEDMKQSFYLGAATDALGSIATSKVDFKLPSSELAHLSKAELADRSMAIRAQVEESSIENPQFLSLAKEVEATAPPTFINVGDEVKKLDASFNQLGIFDTLGAQVPPGTVGTIPTWGPRSNITSVPDTGIAEPAFFLDEAGRKVTGGRRVKPSAEVEDPTKVTYWGPYLSQLTLYPETTLKGRPLALHSAGIETQQLGTERTSRGELILDSIEVGLDKKERLGVRQFIETVVDLDKSRSKVASKIARMTKALRKKEGDNPPPDKIAELESAVIAEQDAFRRDFEQQLSKFGEKVQDKGKTLIRYFKDIWHDNMRANLTVEHHRRHYGQDNSVLLEVRRKIEEGADPRVVTKLLGTNIKARRELIGNLEASIGRNLEEMQNLRAEGAGFEHKIDTDPDYKRLVADTKMLEQEILTNTQTLGDLIAASKVTAKDPIAFITNLEMGKFVIREKMKDGSLGRVLTRAVTRRELDKKLEVLKSKVPNLSTTTSIESDWVNPLKPRRSILGGTQDIFDVIRQYNGTINNRIARKPWEAVFEEEMKLPEYRDETIQSTLKNTKEQLLGGPPAVLEKLVDNVIVQGSAYKIGDKLGLSRLNPSIGGNLASKIAGANAAMKLGYRGVMSTVNIASGASHTAAKVGVEYMVKASHFKNTELGKQLLTENQTYIDPWSGIDVITGKSKQTTAFWKPLGLHRLTEEFTRNNSFLANYLYFTDHGMAHEASVISARRAMRVQQFAYLSSAMPQLLKSKDRRLVGQFRSYMFGEASFLKTLTAKEMMTYLGLMSTMGGPKALVTAAKGLPFISYLWGENIAAFEDLLMGNAMTSEVYSGLPGLLLHKDISTTVAPTFSVGPPPGRDTSTMDVLKSVAGAFAPIVDLAQKIGEVAKGHANVKNAAKNFALENVVAARMIGDAGAVAETQWGVSRLAEHPGLPGYQPVPADPAGVLDSMFVADTMFDPEGWVKDPSTGKKMYKLESHWNIPAILAGCTPLEKVKAMMANSHTAALSKDAELKRKAMAEEMVIPDPSKLDLTDKDVQILLLGWESRMQGKELDLATRLILNAPLAERPEVINRLMTYGVLPTPVPTPSQ